MGNGLRTAEKGHCPKCTLRGQPIVYGLIREESDQFVRGGCSVNVGFDPKYRCQRCGMEFGHGGRNYQVEFKLESEDFTEQLNLLYLNNEKLIQLAATIIEARYELALRGFNKDDLELMGMQSGWQSFPRTEQFEIVIFWNRDSQLIEFATRFKSFGVKHRHGFIMPGRDKWGHATSIESFQKLFRRADSYPLEAWKLRLVERSLEANGVENLELLRLTAESELVSEQLLLLLAEKAPTKQHIPAWFDVEQEYAKTNA
jgi:transposase-like protein